MEAAHINCHRCSLPCLTFIRLFFFWINILNKQTTLFSKTVQQLDNVDFMSQILSQINNIGQGKFINIAET